MKSRTYRSFAVAAIASTALAASVLAAGTANAVTATPPWEPGTAVGTIAFYDSSGNVITGGSTSTAPFAAYAVGSNTVRAGDTQAEIQAANPNPGNADPTSWFRDSLGGFSSYPLSSGPANIKTLSTTNPVAVGSSTDLSLDAFYNESTHYTATGYTNMIQLRMITANSSGQQGTGYDDADILIDPSAHTFQIVYPAPAVTATAPMSPTNVVAVAGNASATVSWTAPTDNGGSAITGYNVQYSDDGGVTWIDGPVSFNTSTATSGSVPGLTNGTSYQFRVDAINSVGASAYSAPSTAVTPVAPPADSTTLVISGPTSATYGAAVTFAATLTDSTTRKALGSQTVSLYRRASSAHGFGLVGTAKTSSSGVARYAVRATANGQYEWRYAGSSTHKAATSTVRTLRVAQTVSIARSPATVKPGAAIKLFGTVNPAVSGQKVAVQQAYSGKWHSVGSATLKRQKLPNGKTEVGYVFAVKLPRKGTYTYRVYKAATSTLGAVYSGKITAKAS